MLRSVTLNTLFLAVSLVSSVSWAEEAPKLKVAALLTLTGNGADGGEWVRRGLEMAKEDFNAHNPGQVDVIFEDTRNEPKEATSIFRNLRQREKLPAVISYSSGVGVALSPMTNADGVLQVGVATASPRYRSEGDLTFRTYPSADLEGVAFARTIVERFGKDKLALLSIENEYGQGLAARIRAELQGAGLSLLADETYAPNETDFKSLIARIKRAEPGVLILSTYPIDTALFVKQARELGYKGTFITGSAVAPGNDFFDRAREAAEGMYVFMQRVDDTSLFYQRYTKIYGAGEPCSALFAARAYDALTLIADASLRCMAISGSCLANQLAKVRDYDGASGKVTFDSAGDSVAMRFGLFKVMGRTLELVR